MTLKFSKEIYPKYVLLKSAYNFTDKAYIHIDSDEKYYIVVINAKEEAEAFDVRDFENEMLTQAARFAVSKRAKNIRELITARSTLVGDRIDDETEDEENTDIDGVLKDWFENENS